MLYIWSYAKRIELNCVGHLDFPPDRGAAWWLGMKVMRYADN